MIFIVDNYDSFTYNLVQAVGKLDPDVVVARNDRFDPDEVAGAAARGAILISPGPGRPENAGRTIEMIAAAERRAIPLLGVCLGHQAIAAHHGGVVERAPDAAARQDLARHCTTAPASSRASPTRSRPARYHSLVVRERDLPPGADGHRAERRRPRHGLAHRSLPVFGVQFHPESVLTPEGEQPPRQLPRRERSAMTPDVAEALKIVAARKPLPRELAERDVPRPDGRQGDGGAEGGAPARHRDARRDRRGDRRRGRRAAGADAARRDARASPLLDTCGPGRHRPRPLQRLDGGGDRRGRRGRRRRQARQPLDLLARRLRGRPRRVRRADRPRPGGRGPRARRGRPRVPLRAGVPPGDEGARHGPARARRADDLQRARPAREPGRRDAGS